MAAGNSGRYRRYPAAAPGSLWMNDVVMRRRSTTGETEPGTWTSVKRAASGNSSQNASRQRSPPRIPVSQSWTSATRMAWIRSARGGPDPLPPVVEELAEGALEGNRHLPPRGLLDLRRVALEDHHVRGSEALRIDVDGDALHRGGADEELEHLLDRPGAARAEIVDLTGLAALEEQPVAPDHVADIREVATRLEIPHPHHGLAPPRLD